MKSCFQAIFEQESKCSYPSQILSTNDQDSAVVKDKTENKTISHKNALETQ